MPLNRKCLPVAIFFFAFALTSQVLDAAPPTIGCSVVSETAALLEHHAVGFSYQSVSSKPFSRDVTILTLW
jgi:hypothetical protein